MFDVDATPVDPDLIDFTSRERAGKRGGHGLVFSQDCGCYIKPMLPKGKVVYLDGECSLYLVLEQEGKCILLSICSNSIHIG